MTTRRAESRVTSQFAATATAVAWHDHQGRTELSTQAD